MGAQIVEIAGQKMAMLPVADYERLLDLVEDKADAIAAATAEQRRAKGEEYVPADLIDRIMAGESALRVWRQFRGLTLRQLGEKVGVGGTHLSQMETGQRRGAPALWRKLANALGVSTDDILPEG